MTARAKRADMAIPYGPQGRAGRATPDRAGQAERPGQAGQTSQTGTGMLDRWTLGALCLHLLLAGVLLAAPQPKTVSGLDQGGRGGGSQMVELTLGGPGGKRPAATTPRTLTPAPSPVPQAQDVKPDAKAVSTRKRDVAPRPTPAKHPPERPATAQTTPASSAPAMAADAVPSGALDTNGPEGAPPGSGGTDKGMAFGSGGGTGGGTTGTTGPGGVGLHADTARDGDYDRKARPLYAPQPPYPAEARRKRAEGVVVVRLHIDPQGRVASRSVVGGEAVDLFADAALSTVERWRFRPCGRDGRDVACEVEVPVVFKLVR